MRRAPYALLVGLMFAANAFAFALAVPAYQAPDEPLHLATARFIHQHLRYPDARNDVIQPEIVRSLDEARFAELQHAEARWMEPGRFPHWHALADRAAAPAGTSIAVAGHPPLYYIVLAPVEAVMSNASAPVEVIVLRIVTMLVALPVVILTFLALRLLWPARPEASVAAAAFVALLPQFAHISAAVNNDAAAASAFTATVYATALVLVRGVSARRLAFGALTASFAVLTKAQGAFALGVFAAGCAWVVGRRDRDAWLRALGAVAVPVVLGALWYGVRLARGLPVSPVGVPDPANAHHTDLVRYVAGFVEPIVTTSFWGRFGWLAVPMPRSWYRVLDVGADLGSIVSMVLVVRAAVRRRGAEAAWVTGVLSAGAGVAIFAGMTYASYHGYLRTGLARGLQGRYLFPVVGVIAVIVTGGWVCSARRFGRLVAAAIVLAMSAVSLEGLWVVLRTFYGSSSPGVIAQRFSRYSGIGVAPAVVVALAAVVLGCAVALAVKLVRNGTSDDLLIDVSA